MVALNSASREFSQFCEDWYITLVRSSPHHNQANGTAEAAVKATVILQVFGVVLISVFSVVNGFTEIKKTPKCEKHI